MNVHSCTAGGRGQGGERECQGGVLRTGKGDGGGRLEREREDWGERESGGGGDGAGRREKMAGRVGMTGKDDGGGKGGGEKRASGMGRIGEDR